MNQVVIGLGSNIDAEKNIAKAKEILSAQFQILQSSQFKITKPINAKNHPDFVNGALLIETFLSQGELKTRLHDIEESLGRPRHSDRSAPRTIDLDIIVWNNLILDQDFYTRDFLKNAVLELLPELLQNPFREGNS